MNLTVFDEHERLRTRLATVLNLSGAAGRAAAPVVDLLTSSLSLTGTSAM
jgi:hypothetical protein